MSQRLSRDGTRHAVGDDEAATAPVPEEMARSAVADLATVKPLTMELIDELTKVHNEGFGSKYCCLVCPIARTPKAVRSFYQRHPERLPYCGVALGKNGEVLGFIQIAIHPMHVRYRTPMLTARA
jgi:hypothetical protein